jgi:hypothetical protein
VSDLDRALWERASALFDELVDLDEPHRKSRLDGIGREQPDLRREVETLLASDAAAGAAADDPLLRVARAAARDLDTRRTGAGDRESRLGEGGAGGSVAPGSRVGDYRLLRRLGQGGMGEVWEAERADGQFEQLVAVKLLKRGFDSPELVARFVRERQILARLDHPGITRLLDGGISEEGRPYLVMERVSGVPITEFVAARGLTLRARLDLFLAVTDAVESAHRALVIHRDLKPSNVLVDAAGRPRLLDFGIAKLLDADDPAATAHFPAPFTPAYAAPEQIAGESITTACDVWALGALLFETLTGRRPFARLGRQPAELMAEVEEEEAPRPSRARTPESPPIDAEVDAIVLRAIRREPGERYPSVDAFAADLKRYLAGRPVQARGDAVAYRARKFLRRHRIAAGAAALVGATLVVGAALALWQAARATREAERARQVERFLVEIFAQADPSRTLGERLSARQVLDRGAERIARELASEPWASASLEEALSRSYRGLGLIDEARAHGERAVALREALEGGGSVDAAAARLTLGEAALDGGDLAVAERLIVDALARLRRADAPATELLRALTALSGLRLQTARYDEALAINQEIYDRSLALYGANHVEVASALEARAMAFAGAGRLAEASPLLADAVARMERAGEGASPRTGIMHTNLADILDTAGRSEEAEQHFKAGLALEERAWGEEHPEVAQTLLKYGIFLVGRRRYSEADAVLSRSAAILGRLDHYDLANAWRYLGYSALGGERFEEAERWFADAEAKFRRELGDDHPLTWAAVVPLAQVRARLGRLEEAESMQRAACAALERLHGPESNEVRVPLKNLGETLRRRGATDEAAAIHRRVLAIERRLFGTDNHAAIASTKRLLALDLLERPTAPNLEEARTLLDPAIAYLRATPAEIGRLPELLETSGRIALAAGDRERGERELTEAVALWEADPEPDPEAARAARRALARFGP